MELEQGYVSGGMEDIFSLGYGPCIGVAIIWNGRVWLLHSSNPYMLFGEEFFGEVAGMISLNDRAKLSPVVFGGSLDDDPDVASDTLISRNWVCDQIATLGFAESRLLWCPNGEVYAQDVEVYPKDGIVSIVTQLHGSGLEKTTQHFLF